MITRSAVICSRVTKKFVSGSAEKEALSGIDFSVGFGELTLVVGPSGCGKTTLLSVIAGTLEPTSGSIEIFGHALSSLSSHERLTLRAKDIGFVFQQFQLLPALNAMENVAVPLIINGKRRHAAFAAAEGLLDELDMADRANAFPRELSTGQQQRVAIARALVHEPRLIICDEPTSSVDAQSGCVVMQLLAERAVQEDRAVLVVTHDNRIFGYADRIVRMNDGQIVSSDIRAPATIDDSASTETLTDLSGRAGQSDLQADTEPWSAT